MVTPITPVVRAKAVWLILLHPLKASDYDTMTALSSGVLYRPHIDMLPEMLDADDKINDEITDLEDVDLICSLIPS